MIKELKFFIPFVIFCNFALFDTLVGQIVGQLTGINTLLNKAYMIKLFIFVGQI